MKLKVLIDQFAAALITRGVPVTRAEATPWLSDFFEQLPGRLPRSYETFVTNYQFPSFELSGVQFFANLGDESEQDLVVAAVADPGLKSVCFSNSLVPIGRPSDGWYDPVCFDLRQGGREQPLVRLDHEEALLNSRIAVRSQIAASFLRLAKDLIAA